MGTVDASRAVSATGSARGLAAAALSAAALVVFAPAAGAEPIPEEPGSRDSVPGFIGAPATPRPLFAPLVPRHPFMAPNGLSNLHVDAYQTDVNRVPGPLGRDVRTVSTFYANDCASVTFDSRGRIVTNCVGLDRPTLRMLDPDTLAELAAFPLPPREPGGGANVFQDFSGGGYFYLDQRDRAVVPTTNRHIFVVQATADPGFEQVGDFDLNPVLASDDKIISALPDFDGLLWFATIGGVVGTVDIRGDGTIRTLDLGEGIGNSFAVDSDGSIFLVSDRAMYRLVAGPDGTPRVSWEEVYDNDGTVKPGQTQAGSGTTPSLMGSDLVAITDNADPIQVVVYRRNPGVRGERLVCEVPVFDEGASSTDNTLVTTRRAIAVENNYGYTGPGATMNGGLTEPGIQRVDVARDLSGCSTRWRNDEVISPTVVPKVSLSTGLLYVYSKIESEDDPWYLTGIDFETGRTVFRALAGTGLGYNNNYAPITLGPDGTAYVGVLGGLVALRDATPPPRLDAPFPDLHLIGGHLRSGRIVAAVVGREAHLLERADFYLVPHRFAIDTQPAFVRVLGLTLLARLTPGRIYRVGARVRLVDGRVLAGTRRFRARRVTAPR